MTSIDQLLERHAQGNIAAPESQAAPALRVAIVTCMDTRIQVSEFFGLHRGEAHVLRNAGGVVTDDVIRSLALSQHKLGTEEVLVMQHTSCGLNSVTDDGFKDELEQVSGLRPTWAVEAFRDVHDSVRQSLERLRRSPYLPHTDGVRGFVYDVDKSALTEVS